MLVNSDFTSKDTSLVVRYLYGLDSVRCVSQWFQSFATLPTETPTDFIRDCRLLFHKNDYSDEFIDTNYYKQNKQNDDFELYVTAA